MPEKNFDSPEVKKKKQESLFIELVDQRDSGWIMDGTAGTKNEVRLTAPSAEFIPNRGFRLAKDANGEWFNEAIRYIKNCPTLSVEEQNKRGFRPSKNKQEDLIIIKKGNAVFIKENTKSILFDYIKEVFYNESNPNRPDSAKAIFRIVEVGRKEEQINETKMAIAEATAYIGNLYQRKGKEYEYNEPKINSLCNIFQVFAETLSGKINGLIAHAEKNPVEFLDKALRIEQTIEMEIGYAIDLNVAHFEGNTFVYSNKDKVIADLGRGNIKHEKKIKRVADLFGTDEYKALYQEFQVELEAAKEKQNK